MTSGRGVVFGALASEYARARPGYPSRLVEAASRRAGLRRGSRVLEIGCGTGQLTRSLVRRGYEVHALEPDPRMAAQARRAPATVVSGHGAHLEIVEQTIEDADLPDSAYDAVFSASAFHWVDPAVGWVKVARVLRPGGRFTLLSHLIVEDAWSSASMRGLLAVYQSRTGNSWPIRSAAQVIGGITQRRDDVSLAWPYADGMQQVSPGRGARQLFGDPRLDVAPWRTTFHPTELIELQRTRSIHIRLDPDDRAAVEEDLAALVERLGGRFRQSHLSVALSVARTADVPAT